MTRSRSWEAGFQSKGHSACTTAHRPRGHHPERRRGKDPLSAQTERWRHPQPCPGWDAELQAPGGEGESQGLSPRHPIPSPKGAAIPDRRRHPPVPLKPLTSQNTQPARLLHPLDKFTQH